MLRGVAILALCVAPLIASAQVFRCQGADGKTVFTDAPCGERVLRAKTPQELANERVAAMQSRQQQAATAAAERDRNNYMSNGGEQQVAANYGGGTTSSGGGDGIDKAACDKAKREVDSVVSMVTLSKSQRETRLVEARRQADLACLGAQRAGEIRSQEAAAPKITNRTTIINQQQPDTRPRFCDKPQGGMMYCF